jgi:FlaA1/EpsC-like NDP-sugar epimerase
LLQKYLRRILFNRWAAFIHDMLWVPVAILAAYWFRFNLQEIPANYLSGYYNLTWLAVPVHAVFFWIFGLYRGLWRFASMPDLIRIVKSVALGSLILTMLGVVLFKLAGVPRTVLVLSPLLLTIGLIGSRLSYRLFRDKRLMLRKKEGIVTLVVGAGHAGELLIRDLISRQEYQPVAIVDDDRKKHDREIHGVRVCGDLSELPKIVRLLDVELVMFAIPSAGRDTVKRVIAECVSAGVECKTLPSIHEMPSGQVEVKQLRPLTLEDLLGREAVKLDQQAIAGYLRQKSVLVTGAGGSIGSELCRQVAGLKPSRLIFFDNGEFNLYSIDNEIRASFPELDIITVLGDVKNKERVDWVFRKFSPHVVFHAAAYKHVPMVELNPAEGVQNNVTGTKVVADAADRYKAERFVLVSTDKAVNPANVMGATKRVAELYCQNIASRSTTRFITTRFGNVLGSAGSVVPLFQQQIRDGGPITVTHRDIKRYFMTIPESVSLILQAGAMGQGGEIFVLDMGDPVLIKDLAEQMIKLSGKVPGQDIKIVYTGLRPGEKLFEEIFHESENLKGTSHHKLLLAGSRKCDWQWLTNQLSGLEQAAKKRDMRLLISHLQSVVPEYNGSLANENKADQPKKPLLKVVGEN